MKIGVIGNLGNVGYNLSKQLFSQGHEVFLFVTKSNTADFVSLPTFEEDHPTIPYVIMRTDTLAEIASLMKEIRHKKFDVLYCLTLAPIYCQELGVPYYCVCTGSDVRETAKGDGFMSFLLRRAYNKSVKVYYVCVDIAQDLKNLGLHPEYLPLWIDPELYYADKRVKRTFVFLPTRPDPIKKIHIGIQGYARATKKGFNSKLVLIAPTKEIEELLVKLGVQDKVEILAWQTKEEMRNLYRQSIVVLDQFSLGATGNIVAEALACGAPVITYINPELYEKAGVPLPLVTSAVTPQQVSEALLSLGGSKE